MNLLGLVVIALNFLMLIIDFFMVGVTFKSSFIAVIIPLVILPVFNIIIVFKWRRNPQYEIKRRGWIIFFNIYVGLFGLISFIVPSEWALLFGTCFIMTSFVSSVFVLRIKSKPRIKRLIPQIEPAQKEVVNKEEPHDLKWWDNYYKDNQQAIDRLENDRNKILINQYNIKPEWLKTGYRTDGNSYIRESSLLYHRKITSEEAAEEYYDGLKLTGMIGNPDVFKDECLSKEIFLNLNKKFTGHYRPDFFQTSWAILLYLFLILLVYGSAAVMLGPNVELFIPSDTWYRGGWILSAVLAIASTRYFYKTGHIFLSKKIVPKRSTIVIMPLLLFLLYGIALAQGAGEMLTEIFGTNQEQVFKVVKNFKTDKTYGRYAHHTKAYCVKSSDFENAFMIEEYCLRQEHYDLLPAQETPMTFIVQKSFFGIVINGYRFADY
jgi:hypothetical protein